jgi:PAS domain S-box-containing protein
MTAETADAPVLSPGDLGIGRLFESVRDAVVVADAVSGRIVLWNPAAEAMFGYTAAEARGLPVEILVPERLKEQHRAGLAGYRATGHGAMVDAGAVVEVPARRKSGDEITVELSLNPIRDAGAGGLFALAIIRDVTERGRLRAEADRRLQESAALEERQRLARELHDAVTQTLFAAGLIADALPNVWVADPDAGRDALAELRRLTWGALAEMRTLLLELRPATLTEPALADLLRQLARAAGGRAALEVAVRADGERRLPPEVQVALYRVAQEALNNAVKHARAHRVELRLRCFRDVVELRVVDDGRGFDPAAVTAGRLGMTGMRERAAAIGAALRVDSRPGAGTRLTVRWRAATTEEEVAG